MKLTCATLLLFFSFIWQNSIAQFSDDQFKLPAAYYDVTLGKSTEAEVVKAFGKPSEREEIKKDQCTEIKNPTTMFYQYADKKIDLRFHKAGKNGKYLLQQIGFISGSPVLFGDTIAIGKSSKEELFKKFGKPEDYQEGDYICYYCKNSKRYYTFLTENNIIVRILICDEKNCL